MNGYSGQVTVYELPLPKHWRDFEDFQIPNEPDVSPPGVYIIANEFALGVAAIPEGWLGEIKVTFQLIPKDCEAIDQKVHVKNNGNAPPEVTFNPPLVVGNYETFYFGRFLDQDGYSESYSIRWGGSGEIESWDLPSEDMTVVGEFSGYSLPESCVTVEN